MTQFISASAPHDAKCFSRALIGAVENVRDASKEYPEYLDMTKVDYASIALSYYDGLIDCICAPANPWGSAQHYTDLS